MLMNFISLSNKTILPKTTVKFKVIIILFWEYIMYAVLCGVCLKQGYSPPPLTNILPGDFWPRRIYGFVLFDILSLHKKIMNSLNT